MVARSVISPAEHLRRRARLAAIGLWVLAAAAWGAAGQEARPAGPTTAPASRRAPRRAPRSRWRPLHPEQIAEVKAFAKQHFPVEHERLERLLAEDAPEGRRLLYRLYWRYVRVRRLLPEARGAAISLQKVNRKIYSTAAQLRRTSDPAARKPLVAALRGLLGEQFDHDQTVKEYEVRRLGGRLEELTAEIKSRRAQRDKLIAERLRSLLSPPAPPGPPQAAPPAALHFRPGERPPASQPPRRLPYRRRPLTRQEEAEVLAFAKKQLPDVHERLLKLRKQDPPAAARSLRGIHSLMGTVRRYPPEVGQVVIKRHRVNVAIFAAVRQHRAAESPGEKQRLRKRLLELLGEQFDYDQTVKEYNVKRLKQQLDDLRALIAQRRRDRDRIIADRLEHLSAPKAPASGPPAPPKARG